MLTELQISNFAIIDNQSIHFESGLNVLSGETGSGKSIILSALELILGGRSSTQSIRTGYESLEVSAHFDFSSVTEEFKKELPDIAQQDELAITRSLSKNGRGKVYINGTLSTVSVLQAIGSKIINICSQSQQIKLLEPAYHLSLLDGYVGDTKSLTDFSLQYERWQKVHQQVLTIQKEKLERETRLIWLEETIAELESIEVRMGLRAHLEAILKSLSIKDKVREKISQVESQFADDAGLLSALTRTLQSVTELSKYSDKYSAAISALQSAKELIFEADRSIRKSFKDDEESEYAVDEISDRLTKLARLERKHRLDDNGLVTLLTTSKREYTLLQEFGAFAELLAEENTLRTSVTAMAEDISRTRKVTGERFVRLVQKELSELNMIGASISLSWEKKPVNAAGIDAVEFLFSANKGESAKPLRMIASGGELSRIMLVMKKILRDRSGVNVLVFDEVDTGISGGVARAVGQKLKSLATQSQVICITHLPQVASYADHHLLVEKLTGKRVKTQVRTLNNNERVDEIARMLSGFEVTDSSRKSAKELLQTAVSS